MAMAAISRSEVPQSQSPPLPSLPVYRLFQGFTQFHEAGDEAMPACREFGVVRQEDFGASVHKDDDSGRYAREMGAAAGVADPGSLGFAAAPLGERSAAERAETGHGRPVRVGFRFKREGDGVLGRRAYILAEGQADGARNSASLVLVQLQPR